MCVVRIDLEKKQEKSQFYYLKCMSLIDISWYCIDDVVYEIDNPKNVGTRYQVNKNLYRC